MGIAELADRVRDILEKEFHPSVIGLSTRNGIVSWVISDWFEAMDDLPRQEAVWDALEKHLGPEERRSISIVIALTPKEQEFHKAGSV